jgi:hypothetical protein
MQRCVVLAGEVEYAQHFVFDDISPDIHEISFQACRTCSDTVSFIVACAVCQARSGEPGSNPCAPTAAEQKGRGAVET